MENTLENKAKFFALYWGQRVLHGQHMVNGNLIDLIYSKDTGGKYWLELTPLSQITYEHLLEIGKIYFNKMGVSEKNDLLNISTAKSIIAMFKSNIGLGSMNLQTAISINNFLISKSYYIGDGTEVSFGWVKLKED